MGRRPPPTPRTTPFAACVFCCHLLIFFFSLPLGSPKVLAEVLPGAYDIASDQPVFETASVVSYLEDPEGELTAAQVYALLKAPPEPGAYVWQTSEERTPNLGFTDSAYWFAMRFHNSSVVSITRYLEVGYPILDTLDAYFVGSDGKMTPFRTGDLRPLSSRPVIHRNFLFPFQLGPGAETTVILRVQTEGALQLPLGLWDPVAFVEKDKYVLAAQFLFVGIMLALGLYNLLIWMMIRDPAYLWYVLNVVTIAIVQMALHGITTVYLWPSVSWLNNWGLLAGIALNIVFVGLFSYEFLAIRRQSKLLKSIVASIVFAGAALFLFSFIGTYSAVIRVEVLAIAIAAPVMLGVSLYLGIKGDPLARFFALAWGLLLIGHFLLAFNKMGVIPRTVVFEYGPQVGAALEGILLSFALGYRMKLERQRREEAQNNLLIAERQSREANEQVLLVQRQANEELEKRVSERTSELVLLNRKLEELSSIDGLTGVRNRGHFDTLLSEEWAKSTRERTDLSLVLLDIDHFKRFNDKFGHQCGDACLQHVAHILEQQVHRAGDYISRYGGEEFCVLLCHTPLTGAARVAERMRLAIEMQPLLWEGERLFVTSSFGVACMTPVPFEDPKGLVKAADEALYGAKDQGRNRVMMYQASASEDGEGSRLLSYPESV